MPAKKKVAAKKRTKKATALPKGLNNLDVVFVLDVTASMGPYIEEAKKRIADITKEIQSTDDLDIQVALAVYRDHPPQDYTFASKGHDFMNPDEFTSILMQYFAQGGGDHPESVYDGLNEVFAFSWREGSDRAVYLIGDAPPHKNCPCGLTSEELILKFKDFNIQVNAHSIANEATTTTAFGEFVEATGGSISTGQRPEHSSELYSHGLSVSSMAVSASSEFIRYAASVGVLYTNSAALSADDISTIANAGDMSIEDATKTVNYLTKRGL